MCIAILFLSPYTTHVIVKVGYVEQQAERKMAKRDYQLPTDPSWTQQWSLVCWQFLSALVYGIPLIQLLVHTVLNVKFSRKAV